MVILVDRMAKPSLKPIAAENSFASLGPCATRLTRLRAAWDTDGIWNADHHAAPEESYDEPAIMCQIR
jgi:hypothetical protein